MEKNKKEGEMMRFNDELRILPLFFCFSWFGLDCAGFGQEKERECGGNEVGGEALGVFVFRLVFPLPVSASRPAS